MKKETMENGFFCKDGLKGLREPKKFLLKKSKTFLLKGLKIPF